MKYLVITEWLHGDINVKYETDSLEDAKQTARMFARTDPKDAHTFITTSEEWESEDGWEEIDY